MPPRPPPPPLHQYTCMCRFAPVCMGYMRGIWISYRRDDISRWWNIHRPTCTGKQIISSNFKGIPNFEGHIVYKYYSGIWTKQNAGFGNTCYWSFLYYRIILLGGRVSYWVSSEGEKEGGVRLISISVQVSYYICNYQLAITYQACRRYNMVSVANTHSGEPAIVNWAERDGAIGGLF